MQCVYWLSITFSHVSPLIVHLLFVRMNLNSRSGTDCCLRSASVNDMHSTGAMRSAQFGEISLSTVVEGFARPTRNCMTSVIPV
jgi:hypothetical protein